MTNYNERLDELISRYNQRYFYAEAKRLLPEDTQEFVESASWAGELHAEKERELFKQALTSLIKEFVTEAKPEKHLVQEDSDIYDDYDHDREQLRHELQENNINIGHNSAIDLYEQNLLKALEEV